MVGNNYRSLQYWQEKMDWKAKEIAWEEKSKELKTFQTGDGRDRYFFNF